MITRSRDRLASLLANGGRGRPRVRTDERESGNGSVMTASDPAADKAATGYPPATPPPASWLPPRRVVTWAVADPLTDHTYSRWRRKRYSWLYEDEDIWASP